MSVTDPFSARDTLPGGQLFHRLDRVCDPSRLPYTICVLLENLLRRAGSEHVTADDVRALAAWPQAPAAGAQLAFMPARVIMQDLTGVPAVVDLAALRDAVARRGGRPGQVDPLVPVDLVIDHSVQVDAFGSTGAYARNIEREYERNGERYALLRWAQGAFGNLRVVPPGMGIVHQVNLEHLASVVSVRDGVAMPDTLVGTDSHTTMVNALGVLGWGVGGIEAEAVMLGEPLYLTPPRVVGIRLHGGLRTGVTATDLVLTMTELLRRTGVVGSFVEFFGAGVGDLTVADRATLSNMSPEFGATAATFPIDDGTLRYLRDTCRPAERVELVERYARAQGLFRTGSEPDPVYSQVLEFDLGVVEPSLAGPRRPQDRVALRDVPQSFADSFAIDADGDHLGGGSVAIAAITSCTNTSNPVLMVAAGLLARNAVARGLRTRPWVKTSLAPGSRVVVDYLERAGLLESLSQLHFDLVGFGCTTCIGNSGPLPGEVAEAVERDDLAVAAVLSGNRNFEARIHPQVRANYLASPPLVVAYALAGTIARDLSSEPLGTGSDGQPVYLRDVWPPAEEVAEVLARSLEPAMFDREYGRIFQGDERWRGLPVPDGELFAWDEDSTYVREATFFEHDADLTDIVDARLLAILGDSVTTDHISPAGAFAPRSSAGSYLTGLGVQPRDLNTYGARRGNHEVMVRGTFANIRLRNLMLDGVEGGYTLHLPSGEQLSIFDAAQRYRAEGVPLVVVAGAEYGSGSSRDWAAKGTALLGVRAVIARSFERIHRSNLVALGVLPVQLDEGDSAESLGLTGHETLTIRGLGALDVGSRVTVEVDGGERSLQATARLDAPADVTVYRAGGLLQMVMDRLVAAA